MKKPIPQLLLCLTAAIWGFSFSVMKIVTGNVPVLALLAIRFTIAAVLLGLIFMKKLKTIRKKDLLWGLLIGASLFFAYVAQTFGLTMTTPGKNAFLTTVYCVIVPFLCWITDRKKPDKFDLIAAVICLCGVALVSLDGSLSLSAGDLLTLLCGLLFAVQITAVAKGCETVDPFVITVLQFAVAASLAWIGHFLFEDGIGTIDLPTAGSLAFLGVVVTAVAFLLQNLGQKYASASSASLLLSLESVFGAFFSVVFGQETLSMRITAGFIVIFVAIVISQTKLSFLRKGQTK